MKPEDLEPGKYGGYTIVQTGTGARILMLEAFKLGQLVENRMKLGGYSCCHKALRVLQDCYCVQVTFCLDHGVNHWGTHD